MFLLSKTQGWCGVIHSTGTAGVSEGGLDSYTVVLKAEDARRFIRDQAIQIKVKEESLSLESSD